jgi:riboflavin kinase
VCLSSAESKIATLIIGPSTGLEAPYPLQMEGKVISGFGRGSRELGIPTANLPVDDKLTPWIGDIKSGVYFGWASLRLPPSHPNQPTTSSDTTTTTTTAPEAHSGFSLYPMVMSIGHNEFYKNTVRSAEAHLLHEFGADFYGVEMRLLITGFIREEKDYAELEELIEDIKVDCDVVRKSLDREAWALRETGKGTLDGSWLVRETAEQKRNREVVLKVL